MAEPTRETSILALAEKATPEYPWPQNMEVFGELTDAEAEFAVACDSQTIVSICKVVKAARELAAWPGPSSLHGEIEYWERLGDALREFDELPS